jgi:broad specificity phosphatase PhoE
MPAHTMTTFYFIRHGEAEHNVAARIHGDGAYMDPAYRDAPLTEMGLQQAEGTRFVLNYHQPFGAIYCSPLRRCIQTLRCALTDADVRAVHLDDHLMEPQGSHICNKRASREEIAVSVPSAWCYKGVDRHHPFDAWSAEAGNQETAHFVNRVRYMTERMTRLHPGQRILVIAHYQWIRTWFRLYMAMDIRPANGQLLVAPVKKLTMALMVGPPTIKRSNDDELRDMLAEDGASA